MIRTIKNIIREQLDYYQLPAEAKTARNDDKRGLPDVDPGNQEVIKHSIAWLCCAQDESLYRDDGVARHFSLIDGWSASYPETTGYIIPTILEFAEKEGREDLFKRVRRMLDWLVSIQLYEGAFQGGLVDSEPVVPVTFNTGQILIGLSAGYRQFGTDYEDALHRAARWLVDTQDQDGCWRSYPSPFNYPGEKTYETHVSWGLLEAARATSVSAYAEAAMANINWALTQQQPNGWFRNCCLSNPEKPLTHTIGYALRGVVEGYLYQPGQELLDACVKTADGLLNAIDLETGYIPGRLYENWTGAVQWSCLTGSVQIALSWLMLHEHTRKEKYLQAAQAAIQYVRRTIFTAGSPNIRGGVKGSFPIHGEYGQYEFLNWACKFTLDACMREAEILQQKD